MGEHYHVTIVLRLCNTTAPILDGFEDSLEIGVVPGWVERRRWDPEAFQHRVNQVDAVNLGICAVCPKVVRASDQITAVAH